MGSRTQKRIKTIAIFTGSRAEYGILKPLMQEIKRSKQLRLQIFVYGMHLKRDFGMTVNEIEKDGFGITARLSSIYEKDSSYEMANYLGQITKDTTKVLKQYRPDCILILGDRIDALGVTLAAAYTNNLIAHIHGGDKSDAGLDEPARHSISKFAHIHFPATKKSAERLIKMGEEKNRIHYVGAPGLDSILNTTLPNIGQLSSELKTDLKQGYLLVVQHPVTTQVENAAQQMGITLKAANSSKIKTIVIYPNADSGGRKMIAIIKRYEKNSYFKAFKNLPHNKYLGLMKNAKLLLGNSSSGIIESASFKLPVINIGDRQNNRECSDNVIHVPHNVKLLKKAIGKALTNKQFLTKVKKCRNHYGTGTASKKIVKILQKVRFDPQYLQKRITY